MAPIVTVLRSRGLQQLLALLTLSTLSISCKDRTLKPKAHHAAAAAASASKAVKISAGPPIAPITFSALKQEPADAVVTKLLKAHYDPERLGLKKLKFRVRLTLKNKIGTTIVAAKGSWQAKGAPEIEIDRVVRDGKQLEQNKGINETLWTSLKFRARRLLDGVGHGFLRQRLEGFKGQQGSVSVDKGKLQLTFKHPKQGETTVVIAGGYRIEQLRNVSPLGVTRTMTYKHRVVGGRNLVVAATMTAKLHPGAKVPDKGAIVMKAADGMRYRIEHTKVGRYHLPSKLHRVMPNSNAELSISLRYDLAQ